MILQILAAPNLSEGSCCLTRAYIDYLELLLGSLYWEPFIYARNRKILDRLDPPKKKKQKQKNIVFSF